MSSLKQAIDDLLNHQLTTKEAVGRHFSPEFRQRVNGNWIDRANFLAGIDQFRAVVERATITVLDEIVDGSRYSERHIVDLAKRDGDRILQEVYVFAERDLDGRFLRIEEATFALENYSGPLRSSGIPST